MTNAERGERYLWKYWLQVKAYTEPQTQMATGNGYELTNLVS